MTFKEEFGNRLKEARSKAGLTQGELSSMVMLTTNAICMYEKARRLPNLETFALLVQALGVTCDDLMPEPQSQISFSIPGQMSIYDKESDDE